MSESTERGYGGDFPAMKVAAMEKSSLTIAEFILQRIAEDEAVARAYADGSNWGNPYAGDGDGSDVAYSNRFDSTRVLAECEAKRRIINFHQSWPVLVQTPAEFDRDDAAADVDTLAFRMSSRLAWLTDQEYRNRFGDEPPTGPMLAALAAVYSDHEDYHEAWRP